LSRARVTQITNLTLLAPKIQEAILAGSSTRNRGNVIIEHQMRSPIAHADWQEQRSMKHGLNGDISFEVLPS
jgi:hypothetical protein